VCTCEAAYPAVQWEQERIAWTWRIFSGIHERDIPEKMSMIPSVTSSRMNVMNATSYENTPGIFILYA